MAMATAHSGLTMDRRYDSRVCMSLSTSLLSRVEDLPCADFRSFGFRFFSNMCLAVDTYRVSRENFRKEGDGEAGSNVRPPAQAEAQLETESPLGMLPPVPSLA